MKQFQKFLGKGKGKPLFDKKGFSFNIFHYKIIKQNIIDAIKNAKLIAVLIRKYFFFSSG